MALPTPLPRAERSVVRLHSPATPARWLTNPTEMGTPALRASVASGRLFGSDGSLTELAPPTGAVNGGFSITVPLTVVDDTLFIAISPIDGGVPAPVEIARLEIVLFRDDAQAFYDVPLEEVRVDQ